MQHVHSGSAYEPRYGFSRAVRVDDRVFVAGTAPIPAPGEELALTAYAQARRCCAIIVAALEEPWWASGWASSSLSWDALRRGEFERVPGLVRDAWETRADISSNVRTFMLGPLVSLSAYTGDEAPMLEARALLE